MKLLRIGMILLTFFTMSVSISFSMSVAAADVSSSMQDEIDHLLDYVAKTDCQYERNGTLHNADEAINHINKKYEYFKDDIKSTEDFIKYSATKSKMSGKFYKIHCAGVTPIKSQVWLQKELTRYRKQGRVNRIDAVAN